MLPRQPWSTESLLRLLTHLFLVLGGVLLISGAAERVWADVPEEARRFWLSFASGGAVQVFGLVLIARCVQANGMTWQDAFGLRREQAGRMVGLGILTAFAALLLSTALLLLSRWALEAIEIPPKPQASIEALQQTQNVWRRLVVALSAIALAPVFEETLFRGLLYTAIRQAGYPRTAVWGTSALFALTHMNLMTFVPLLVFALILTSLYARTGHLLAPITAHAVFNAVNYAFVLLSDPPA